MIARALAIVAIASGVASADAPKLVAVVADPGDVGAAILVGPGGQVYAPDGAGGWARASAGGIAGGATAAVRAGGDVMAAGNALYVWKDGAWNVAPLPIKGAPLLGVGPAASAAIGTAIVVRGAKGWTRVPDAPSAPTALWAASETQVIVVAGGVAWRLRGKAFVRGGAATALAPGPRPLALAGASVMDLSANRPIKAGGEVIAAAAGGRDVWILARASGGLAIERHAAKRTDTTPAPGTAAWTWIWADAKGKAAIAAPTGELAILDGGAWREIALQIALPAARAGAGPARSP